MKIGIIGSGNIGGTLGLHFAEAGHEVMFSSRHPQELESLVGETEGEASTGTVAEAADFTGVLLLAVPYKAIPEVARETNNVAEKIIIDATNPFPTRDGEIAEKQSVSNGSATEYVAGYFPSAHITKAFNTIYYKRLKDQAFQKDQRRAIPYAGDHQPSLNTLHDLIKQIGFGPVYIGSLSESRIMEPGQPLFTNDLTVRELQKVVEE